MIEIFQKVNESKYRWAQEREEILAFAAYCSAQLSGNIRFAEIGCLYGCTMVFLGNVLSKTCNVKAYGINKPLPKDWNMYRGDNLQMSIESIGPKFPFKLIEGDSQAPETIASLKKELSGEQLDLLFIDGNHNGNYPRQDFDKYQGFVRKGGIIAIHDIKSKPTWGVRKAWAHIRKLGRPVEISSCPERCGIGAIIK